MRGREFLASIDSGRERSTHLSKYTCNPGGNFYCADLCF
jgi:hypothetical protein